MLNAARSAACHLLWRIMQHSATESAVDGLPPGEGTLLPCSFWLLNNYVLQGRASEACAMFDRLIAICNDVGLLSEEYDPRSGRLLGNFAQALSRLSLVNTAMRHSGRSGVVDTSRAVRRYT